MKDKLLKIINHYGVMPQLKYFQSEVFELNEAIITYEDIEDSDYFPENKKHIAEEIADVLVMLEQFRYYYNIDIVEVNKIAEQKVERQLERIENEPRN